jgi:hypothetical protein
MGMMQGREGHHELLALHSGEGPEKPFIGPETPRGIKATEDGLEVLGEIPPPAPDEGDWIGEPLLQLLEGVTGIGHVGLAQDKSSGSV